MNMGMKHGIAVFVSQLMVSAVLLTLSSGCDRNDGPDLTRFSGVVINEVAAHDERTDAESWVELVNTSSGTVDLSGLGLFLYDEYFDGMNIHDFAGQSLSAGERMVLSTADDGLRTGFASDAQFELRLAPDRSGEAVDSFSRDAISSPGALPVAGSYQRIPDGNGTWTSSPAASRGKANLILSLENTKHNAIWLWSTHMKEWLADDAAVMKRMKALGYDHVLLNYAAFQYSNAKTAREFMAAAADAGIMVHAWIQCFYNGGWVSPVIDAENRYDQALFDDIIERANGYIDEFGVQGIHLDYIRFGGTAYKHNPSAEITAVGAVTEFCRQIREAMDARGENIILSAAMMAEDNAAYYYGQNAAQMGLYIHILMPMIYRYQEGGVSYSTDWCMKMVRLFTTVTDAQVWAGTQTYSYVGNNVSGLDEERLRSDCEDFVGSGASGIVLFRYALGTFPDVNDLWESE